MMLGRKKFQKKFPEKPDTLLGEGTKASLSELLKSRGGRATRFFSAAKAGAKAGVLIAGVAAYRQNPSFRRALAGIIGGSVLGAVLVAGASFKKNSRMVKEATGKLKEALVAEAADNTSFRFFLAQWPYVFIDKKGMITGSNSERVLGIGRLRIKSTEITEGAGKLMLNNF